MPITLQIYFGDKTFAPWRRSNNCSIDKFGGRGLSRKSNWRCFLAWLKPLKRSLRSKDPITCILLSNKNASVADHYCLVWCLKLESKLLDIPTRANNTQITLSSKRILPHKCICRAWLTSESSSNPTPSTLLKVVSFQATRDFMYSPNLFFPHKNSLAMPSAKPLEFQWHWHKVIYWHCTNDMLKEYLPAKLNAQLAH